MDWENEKHKLLLPIALIPRYVNIDHAPWRS